jgi:hypothetical protein
MVDNRQKIKVSVIKFTRRLPACPRGRRRRRRMLVLPMKANASMRYRISFLAGLIALPAMTQAQMPAPGLWQIGAQTQAVGVPVALAPMAIEHCLTADEARDPSRLLGRLSSPGATDCAYTDSAYTGSNFHFAMACGGMLGIKATGDVTFTASTLAGAIDSTATVNGQPIALRSSLSARRLGDCPAPHVDR